MKKKSASIFCAIFRHSHLVTNCMGYKYCARCGTQLGDVVASVGLPTPPYFGIGQTCQCEGCRKSFDGLTWIDRFMCPKAVWPTDEYVESERKKKFNLIKYLEGRRAAREVARLLIAAVIFYLCWLAKP